MANQVGLEVYSKVRRWFFRVVEVWFSKLSKVYSFFDFSLTHKGMLSVTKMVLVKTGIRFSSPSVKFPDLATTLYWTPCIPSGIFILHVTVALLLAAV